MAILLGTTLSPTPKAAVAVAVAATEGLLLKNPFPTMARSIIDRSLPAAFSWRLGLKKEKIQDEDEEAYSIERHVLKENSIKLSLEH
ncbi:hypothetical protein O1611_g5841 [Lasiodiplodia mahajangana]|uniref:Uncharacterized protein n=1 Tax=Lasiodiplodia mahajangana TaxID=1108764 RepID=A0ACC2JKR9_9PEZI|nr:hypothetical protein O1611_g5841 [Lasiodiplodia mahajangana]